MAKNKVVQEPQIPSIITKEISDADLELQNAAKYINENYLSKIDATVWVAGGAIRQFINKEIWIDTPIDLYSPDQENLKKAISCLESTKHKKIDDNYLFTTFLNEKNVKLRLTKKSYRAMDYIIQTFNFTADCCVIGKNVICYWSTFLDDIEALQICVNPYGVYNANKFLEIFQRYVQMGYTASPEMLDTISRHIVNSYTRDKATDLVARAMEESKSNQAHKDEYENWSEVLVTKNVGKKKEVAIKMEALVARDASQIAENVKKAKERMQGNADIKIIPHEDYWWLDNYDR